MSERCEADWGFDVDFEVSCELPPGHVERHRALVEGTRRDELEPLTWDGDQA